MRFQLGPVRALRFFLPALLIFLPVSPGQAGSFQVTPITVTASHDRPVAAVTVTNSGSEPVSIKVSTLRWIQQDGEDRFLEGSDLIASPPLFTIAPNRSQVIRVGLRRANGDDLAAYRLVLEEIPSANVEGGGIRVALRLNLPFYILPRRPAQAELDWSVERQADGNTRIVAANRGGLHDQINRIDLLAENGERVVLVERASTVLPGSAKRWEAGGGQNIRDRTARLVIVRPGGEQTVQARVNPAG